MEKVTQKPLEKYQKSLKKQFMMIRITKNNNMPIYLDTIIELPFSFELQCKNSRQPEMGPQGTDLRSDQRIR